MKKLIFTTFLILSILSCKKKTEFSPEGPTDVRIRNISTLNFENVIVSTSEEPLDIDTIVSIPKQSVSEYSRFTKAYPKAKISANININGTLLKFSTGEVDYTFMQYIGQDRITFEVNISDQNNRVLSINNVILEEPLVLK
jgi:hypothetical protein